MAVVLYNTVYCSLSPPYYYTSDKGTFMRVCTNIPYEYPWPVFPLIPDDKFPGLIGIFSEQNGHFSGAVSSFFWCQYHIPIDCIFYTAKREDYCRINGYSGLQIKFKSICTAKNILRAFPSFQAWWESPKANTFLKCSHIFTTVIVKVIKLYVPQKSISTAYPASCSMF